MRVLVTRWISAKEAIRLVGLEFEASDPDLESNAALSKAETALLARLRHGALKSVASTFKFTIHGESPWGEDDKVFAGANDEVPADFWHYIAPSYGWGGEWVSGDFSIEMEKPPAPASGAAFNVHFDADNLPGLTSSPIAPPPNAPDTTMDNAPARGRPAKWDWEGALAYLIALANLPDGLDDLADGQLRQADLERALSEWFIRHTGNAPATSQIRARASAIMRAISEVDKSKPHF